MFLLFAYRDKNKTRFLSIHQRINLRYISFPNNATNDRIMRREWIKCFFYIVCLAWTNTNQKMLTQNYLPAWVASIPKLNISYLGKVTTKSNIWKNDCINMHGAWIDIPLYKFQSMSMRNNLRIFQYVSEINGWRLLFVKYYHSFDEFDTKCYLLIQIACIK